MAQTPCLEVIPLHSPLHYALIGGDDRQLWLARLLEADGHTVTRVIRTHPAEHAEEIARARRVLLPIPLRTEADRLYAPLCPAPVSLSETLSLLHSEQTVFGGGLPPDLYSSGLRLCDLLKREEVAIANAVPTAEGAVAIAIDALPITLRDSRVLVTGFGRVGQCVARSFRALGAAVTVCARSPAQRALAGSMDCRALPLPVPEAGNWDLVINTVPAPALPRPVLERLGRPVLLELASAPGGFDPKEAAALGLRAITARGLPGKTAPATAARILRDTLALIPPQCGP